MKRSVLLCLMMACMLTHPAYVTEGARYGLLLWYQSVVPALFPFMVLSSLIVAGGGISILMAPVCRVIKPWMALSPNGCYVLLTGLLCGCPMGAKTCADFVREGRIPLWEGKLLLAVCNHPSPMFLLGYVSPLLAPDTDPVRLLISVYGPVFILGLFARYIYRGTCDEVRTSGGVGSFTLTIDSSILAAVELLCRIGGYLILFSVVIVFLQNAEWLPSCLRLALIGAMEITTGIRELAACLSGPAAACAVTAAFTFGGFSGLFQTRAVIGSRNDRIEKKAGLSIRQYFFWKLIHASLSVVIMFLFQL